MMDTKRIHKLDYKNLILYLSLPEATIQLMLCEYVFHLALNLASIENSGSIEIFYLEVARLNEGIYIDILTLNHNGNTINHTISKG
jgi:hypothetical protein